jgi:hypothetical protein
MQSCVLLLNWLAVVPMFSSLHQSFSINDLFSMDVFARVMCCATKVCALPCQRVGNGNHYSDALAPCRLHDAVVIFIYFYMLHQAVCFTSRDQVLISYYDNAYLQ